LKSKSYKPYINLAKVRVKGVSLRILDFLVERQLPMYN
jgi:hypothetical protein